MRVLITTDWYEPVINGVVTSVMNLSRQLRERGHEVKILTLSRTFHSYIEGDVVYAGSIGLGCIYPQARLKIPKAAGDYMEMLLEWKPDIVHSQCEFSTFFLAKRIASDFTFRLYIRTIQFTRTIPLFFTAESMGKKYCAVDDKETCKCGRNHNCTQ